MSDLLEKARLLVDCLEGEAACGVDPSPESISLAHEIADGVDWLKAQLEVAHSTIGSLERKMNDQQARMQKLALAYHGQGGLLADARARIVELEEQLHHAQAAAQRASEEGLHLEEDELWKSRGGGLEGVATSEQAVRR